VIFLATKPSPAEQQLSEGLTIREFARLNKISEVTARRHVNSGKIPSYLVGGSRRIRVDDAAAIQQTDLDDVDAEIKRLVDLAPKLTPAQRDTIASLFATAQDGGDAA
jgi:excisionase family DNA binding protein